jgi:hypothetical protein
MQLQDLPIECQIEIMKYYPLYRTLCKVYNHNCHSIFDNYYGTQKISLQELKKYITEYKPASFNAFYNDKWQQINISYKDNIRYHIHTYYLSTTPIIFESYYTNCIKLDKYYTYEYKLNINNYICVSPEITTGILKHRLNCTNNNYITNFLQHDKRLSYKEDVIYNTDLTILLLRLKCYIFNNLYHHNIINLFNYNLAFHYQQIQPKYKDMYDALLTLL